MIVAYKVHSHQRGIGVSSSSIPSHSCPTVSVPVAGSMRFLSSAMVGILEDHGGSVAVAVAVAGQEGPADEDQIRHGHGDQAPAVGEVAEGVVAHRTCSCAAPALKST